MEHKNNTFGFYITHEDLEHNFKKHRVYWFREQNVILFSTPKSANTSITQSIFGEMGITERFPKNDPRVMYINPRLAYYIKLRWPETKVLCLLRNPKTRLLSCYNDSILRGPNTALIDWGFPFVSDMKPEAFVDCLDFVPQHELDIHGRSVSFETNWGGLNLVDEYVIIDDLRTKEGKMRVGAQLTGAGFKIGSFDSVNVTPKRHNTIPKFKALPKNEWFQADVELYAAEKLKQRL